MRRKHFLARATEIIEEVEATEKGARFSRSSGRRGGKPNWCGGGNRKFNPLGPNGNPSKCNICSSIMHWARECPNSDKSKNSAYECSENNQFETNIVLINIKHENKENYSPLGETAGSMVLDSGCSRSVCGLVWY